MSRRMLAVAVTTLTALAFAAVASAAPPRNTAQPTVEGTAVEGQLLSAGTGEWANAPTRYTYRWERCTSTGAEPCTAIPGATERTYRLTTQDVGRTVRVIVTAANAE